MFDVHHRAFAFFEGACTRGIYDNLNGPVDAIFVGRDAKMTTVLPDRLTHNCRTRPGRRIAGWNWRSQTPLYRTVRGPPYIYGCVAPHCLATAKPRSPSHRHRTRSSHPQSMGMPPVTRSSAPGMSPTLPDGQEAAGACVAARVVGLRPAAMQFDVTSPASRDAMLASGVRHGFNSFRRASSGLGFPAALAGLHGSPSARSRWRF